MKAKEVYLSEEKTITEKELNEITVKQLENKITGKTNGGSLISEINGNEIIWEYRKQDGIYNPVCGKEDADQITIITDNGYCIRTIIL